ncbi:MAG: hypothetical protein ACYDHU_11570 [Acidimicrobiales bacterium]
MSPDSRNGPWDRLAQAVAERVVKLALDALDVDALVSRVDVNAIVERVDVDALVSRVDVDRIVSRVDVDALVDRVDVERIIDRVDVNAIVERVDVSQVVDRLDIDALVAQTELGSIIAKSTTGVLTEILDLLRSQGVGLDDFLARWVNRILRRAPGSLPLGPGLLIPAAGPSTSPERSA